MFEQPAPAASTPGAGITIRLLVALLLIGVNITPLCAQETWRPTDGPYGGVITTLAVRGDTMLTGGLDVFRSLDGGRDWTRVLDRTVTHVVIDSDGVMWAALYSGVFMSSSDHGVTWIDATPFLPPHFSIAQIAALSHGGRIAAGFDSTLNIARGLVSYDHAGRVWEERPSRGLPNKTLYLGNGNGFAVNNRLTGTLLSASMDPDSVAILFTMLRSDDTCGHFERSATGLPHSASMNYILAAKTTDDGMFYTSVYTMVGAEYHYVNYRSTDDGRTWISDITGLPPFAEIQSIVCNINTGVTYANAHSGPAFGGLYTGIYRSTDRGKTWTEALNKGLEAATVQSLAISGDGTLFAFGGNPTSLGVTGGLYRSSDGGDSWTLSNHGINHAPAQTLALDSMGHVFACVAESGLHRTTDQGAHWLELTNGIRAGGTFHVAVAPSGVIFAGGEQQGVYRSTDDGDSWIAVNSGLPNIDVRCLGVTTGGTLIIGTPAGMFTSTDDGMSWLKSVADLSSAPATCLAVSGNGFCVAGTANGVYHSHDAGRTWIIGNEGLTNVQIAAVGFSGTGDVLLSTPDGVYRSTDNAQTWTASDRGLDHPWSTVGIVTTFARRHDGRLVCGRTASSRPSLDERFVFSSTDDGRSWTQFDTLIGVNLFGGVVALVCDSNNVVFAATGGSGVWRTDSVRSGIAGAVSLPAHVTLSKAFPNPTSATTAVHVANDTRCTVSVSLVDLFGDAVRTVFTGICDAGERTFTLNSSELRTGTYWCVVQAGGARVATPIVVVR